MPELTPDGRARARRPRRRAGRPPRCAGPDRAGRAGAGAARGAAAPRPTSFGAELDAKVERGFRDPDPRRASEPPLVDGAAERARARDGRGGAARRRDRRRRPDRERRRGRRRRQCGASRCSDSTTAAAARPRRPRKSPPAPPRRSPLRPPTAPPSRSRCSGGAVPPAPAPRADGRERRSVERSASLTLAARPRDIDAVSARVQEVTRQQGGFVVSSSVSSSTNGGGGQFELRVPTRNLDSAIAALSRLASVRERCAARGGHHGAADLRPQPAEGRAHRAPEPAAAARRGGDGDRDGVDPRGGWTSSRARSRRARRDVRRVNNRAAFSTVAVTLVADRSAGGPARTPTTSWTPGDAAKDALRRARGRRRRRADRARRRAAAGAARGARARSRARWSRRRRREHALDAV